MEKKEKAYYLLNKMEELFPNATTELENWETPFQFLICIILSAQMTDAGVNKVTGELFKQYPDAEALSSADPADVVKIIRSVNYYRSKVGYIIETSRMIVENFNGKVPETIEELVTLRGVGSKTANVFLNTLYEANLGIGADTHVMRVSRRMGLTRNKTAEKVAKDLEAIYDREDWHRVNTLYVLYGRYYCKAVISGESKCVFKDICSYCKDK